MREGGRDGVRQPGKPSALPRAYRAGGPFRWRRYLKPRRPDVAEVTLGIVRGRKRRDAADRCVRGGRKLSGPGSDGRCASSRRVRNRCGRRWRVRVSGPTCGSDARTQRHFRFRDGVRVMAASVAGGGTGFAVYVGCIRQWTEYPISFPVRPRVCSRLRHGRGGRRGLRWRNPYAGAVGRIGSLSAGTLRSGCSPRAVPLAECVRSRNGRAFGAIPR